MKKPYNAKLVARYYQIYRQYLMDNQLENDSDTITVKTLIEFVETEISDEDRLSLADKII